MPSKSKLITLTDEMQVKIKELQDHLGYPSQSMVIYHSIMTLYQKTFPPHTQMLRRSPREVVEDKKKQKEAQIAMERERKLEIVRQLGGTIEVTDAGEMAVYFTYALRKRYRQEVPLHLITEDLITSQYSPDRATVERLQAEKKVDY